jgi:5'-nucleotidase
MILIFLSFISYFLIELRPFYTIFASHKGKLILEVHNNRMKRIFALALLVLMVACATARGTEPQRVVIVSTNDIHSSIEAFPRLATFVEELRTKEGTDNVLLVDAGDRWTGNPFVDLTPEPYSPIIELMNALGYDVTTLGNHEFDRGQEVLRRRIDEMDFPVVCANIESRDSELGPIEPYVIVKAGGIRFAFLGLVHNFTPRRQPEGKEEHFVGVTFPDVYKTAEKYAYLADECDVFVGLTHIGIDRDKELARRVPALDLIIGGHTHTRIERPDRVGDVLVTQAGSKLEYAGVTTITKYGDRLTIENRLVPLRDIAPSPRFAEMVATYNANPELLAPIGSAAVPFNSSGVKNLVTDAVREGTGADVSLYHSGGIRISYLAGKIKRADLYRIEPFESEVYTLRMTPGQIKGMIMARWNDPENPVHSPDIMASGVGYTVTTNEAGEAVNVTFDRPEKSSYLVAMPDYLYKNYSFDRSEEPVKTGRLVTDILRDYITAHSPLAPDNSYRIFIK